LEKEVDANVLRRARSLALTVTGMECINCANRVRNALLAFDGVYRVDIDLESGMAGVLCDPEGPGLKELITAVSLASKGTRHVYRAWPVAAPGA